MKMTEKRKRLARIFEKYVRLGLNNPRLDVFIVCERIDGYTRAHYSSLADAKREAKDLFAVWETCRLLRVCKREEELKIFEDAYLSYSRYGTVKLSSKYYLDERTLYRRLAYVEKQYETVRRYLE